MEQWAAALARRMIQGDGQAFDELAEHFYPKLRRMAYLISGSDADSEDIVQEVFVQCWVNRERIREPESIATWFYKTLTREAWRVCKRSRKELPVEDVYGENTPVSSTVLEEIILLWDRQELCKAIEKLPVKQRTVVVLYYYNELSTKEIARIMGCLEGTVKSRLHTARGNLKKSLTRKMQAKEREAAL